MERFLKRAASGSAGGAAPRSKRPRAQERGWCEVRASMLWRGAGRELPALRAESGAGGDDAAALPKVRVAAFDVDQTLVSTRDGTWAKSADDWQPLNAHVKRTLERLHARGYVVALFSTQNSIRGALSGKRATMVKSRFDQIIGHYGVPALAFAATQKGDKDPCGFRKPRRGMWDFFVRTALGGREPDMDASFFVGDAAGRPSDHSADDRGFAEAAGLRFLLPEEAFGGGGLDEVLGEDAGAAPVAEVEATADDGAATGGAKGAAAVEVVELSSDEDERRLRENTP